MGEGDVCEAPKGTMLEWRLTRSRSGQDRQREQYIQSLRVWALVGESGGSMKCDRQKQDGPREVVTTSDQATGFAWF